MWRMPLCCSWAFERLADQTDGPIHAGHEATCIVTAAGSILTGVTEFLGAGVVWLYSPWSHLSIRDLCK